MLPSLKFSFIPLFGSFLLCTATEILPRAPYADHEQPAFDGLHDVIVARDGDLDLPSAFLPRMRHLADASQKLISANSSSALTKRQFTCDPGYGLCDDSVTCCPTGWGCCPYGSCCDSGFFCCGTENCAVDGGECCDDGSYCDAGLHCVILDGVQGCCANLDCNSFDSGPPVPTISIPSIPSISITPFSFTPISFTPISLTPISFTPISFTPISITPITDLSIPTFTFPSITIPTITVPTSLTTEYFWYTTTFTWFYYSYFITYIAPVSQPTSTRTFTTEIVSIYASNKADATSQFASLSSGASFPTAVTAPGFTNSLPSPTNSISASPTLRSGGDTTGGGGSPNGGVKGVEIGRGGLGAAVVMGCLGMFTCWLMVWL